MVQMSGPQQQQFCSTDQPQSLPTQSIVTPLTPRTSFTCRLGRCILPHAFALAQGQSFCSFTQNACLCSLDLPIFEVAFTNIGNANKEKNIAVLTLLN